MAWKLSNLRLKQHGLAETYFFCVVVLISDVSESLLSSLSRKPFESESSKNFSSQSQSHDLVNSNQSRITGTVESLGVIGLQARVNVESHEISRFFYNIIFLWNGTKRQWCSRDYNLRDRDLTQISRRDRDFVIKAETETWKFETETSHFSDGN